MDILAIAPPDDWPQEAGLIVRLLDAGLLRYHLRKPRGSLGATEALLQAIPADYHQRLSLHQHYELAGSYGVSIHHKSGGAQNVKASSCSLHSLGELTTKLGAYQYAILSPVFASLSKPAHGPNWSESVLREALRPARSAQVYALGGMHRGKVSQVESLGFDGVVLHGALWQASDPLQVFNTFRVLAA